MVFAPEWGSEQTAECSYRYGLSIAEEYGGDPNQPVTYPGHSLGAEAIHVGGLDDAAYGPGGTYDECFEGGARPSLLVPISGCHYEYEDDTVTGEPIRVEFPAEAMDKIRAAVRKLEAECDGEE